MREILFWLSGADRQVLQACTRLPKSERTRFSGLGALVLIPAVLGLFSMTYAVSTVSSYPPIYVAAGIAWFLAVVAIDRFLVATIHKSVLPAKGRWLSLAARYIFAVLVGVAVSHPLVLLWFDQSIEQQLLRNRDEEVAGEFSEAESLKSSQLSSDLAGLLASKTEYRDCLQKLLTAEQSGVRVALDCGNSSGLPDCGKRCAILHDQLEQLNGELGELSARIAAEDERNNERAQYIDELTKVKVQRINEEFSSDYLARVDALADLERASPHVLYVKWFMLAFFIFVDILPITMKLATPMGEYEHHRDTLLFESQLIQEAEREVIDVHYRSDAYRSIVQAKLSHRAAREGITAITQTTNDFVKEQERQSESFDRQFVEISRRIEKVKDADLKQYHHNHLIALKDIFNKSWAKAMERFHVYLEGL